MPGIELLKQWITKMQAVSEDAKEWNACYAPKECAFYFHLLQACSGPSEEQPCPACVKARHALEGVLLLTKEAFHSTNTPWQSFTAWVTVS